MINTGNNTEVKTKNNYGNRLEIFIVKLHKTLNLKHLEAFKRFLDQDLDFALFLEDDCRFTNSTKVETVIEEAPENWDVIFLGGAFSHGIITPISLVAGSYILAQHPSTNTTSSIIYNKDSVRKILPHMESFCNLVKFNTHENL